MAPYLSAVILAAGLSSRMGELKPALPLGQSTVLEQCLTLFRDCGIEDLVVVTGHRSAEISAIAARAGARLAPNPEFATGMYSSIRAGVRQIAEQSRGFFLLPVDIPLVRPGTVRLLSQSFAATAAWITYPLFAGQRGHPPLLARELISEIIAQKDADGGLRARLGQFENQDPRQVCEVRVPDANILFDMDTPEEYGEGLQRFARRDYPTMEECEVILDYCYPIPEKGRAHGRLVAEIAVALCEALRRQGRSELNAELCRVCGWLHDIAKGHARHEHEGACWLDQLGFSRAAAIVAAHRDLDWQPRRALSETEIVHLADKLARGNRVVGVGERFEEKLLLYKDNPEAVLAIRSRSNLAVQLAAAFEAEAGQTLGTIAALAAVACSR